ncbi:hypothetical protein J1614_006972 [Plenodomus biglobosus]|nr:hypothetical protein J1614_006972 [Plenodomus biglobosus]
MIEDMWSTLSSPVFVRLYSGHVITMKGVSVALSIAISCTSLTAGAVAAKAVGTYTSETVVNVAWHPRWSAGRLSKIQATPTWLTTKTVTTTDFPDYSSSIETSRQTMTVTVDSNNVSASTDYMLHATSTQSSIGTTLPEISPSNWMRESTSSLSTSTVAPQTTSIRSPSLFPPNGLANHVSCQCSATAPRGIYCGYCSQIKTCTPGSNCWASMFSCGKQCKDYGWNAHCAQAARTTPNEVNCPIQWQ